MAATKERYQNPTVGDTVNLRWFTYNSNNFADVNSISKVEIYYLDKTLVTPELPDGRRLVDTLDGSGVIKDETGSYHVSLNLPKPKYVIGDYKDVWSFYISDNDPTILTVENNFKIYPELWYTSPIPIVYDFEFRFQPNKLRQGSRQYLIIETVPNVPRASDLEEYYSNLAIAADLSISIEQQCGNCTPEEADLRLEVDQAKVNFRENRFSYYQIDTTDWDCGVYNIWFKLEFGGNIYISNKYPLLIYS